MPQRDRGPKGRSWPPATTRLDCQTALVLPTLLWRNRQRSGVLFRSGGALAVVDCERQQVETFTNVRGRMVAGTVFSLAESVTGDPFGAEPVPVAEILA